jgi:exopolyphosphatase / guanosine-5'-triphosphate,3'-diphosphate pyrophosphatase
MIIGALDIGSNSIHLVVVETSSDGSFRVLASGKEMVRLGRSVARDRKLSNDAIDRAVETIGRFNKLARELGATEMITAATSATREATNRNTFIKRVADETGVHLDTLSGIEEARLISLAVAARVKPRPKQRLLGIDIGGGSTEVTITQNGEPTVLISFNLGAVRLTQQFMSSDPIGKGQLRRLRTELREVISQRAAEISAVGFDLCLGTSGTINALATTLWHRRHAKKLPSAEAPESGLPIGIDELRDLNEEMASLDLGARADFPGMSKARAEIIVTGGQLLEAMLDSLKIEKLTTCDWSLREGVIIAYLARQALVSSKSSTQLEKDPSLRGALALLDHYNADRKHALLVASFARQLFDQLRPLHLLGNEHRRLLLGAALLHDIGHFVAHSNHNKHSAYLIQNSELTGFMASELAIIANIARYHRSSIPKVKHPYFTALPEGDREIVRKLGAILRVADVFDREHLSRIRALKAEFDNDAIYLTAVSSQLSDATPYRVEERSDLLSDVFGRRVEFKIEQAR